MFTKLTIPKGAVVERKDVRADGKGSVVEAVVQMRWTEDDGPTQEHLIGAQLALFCSIFPAGQYEFPNGLEVPKLRSVTMQMRRGVVVVR